MNIGQIAQYWTHSLISETLSNEYWILCILHWKLFPFCRSFKNITYALRWTNQCSKSYGIGQNHLDPSSFNIVPIFQLTIAFIYFCQTVVLCFSHKSSTVPFCNLLLFNRLHRGGEGGLFVWEGLTIGVACFLCTLYMGNIHTLKYRCIYRKMFKWDWIGCPLISTKLIYYYVTTIILLG